tara:strand:- start:9709 stop:10119 length:411 start_codon:yes stop_codon:yes gene_type:complete
MIVRNEWWESLPESVRDYIKLDSEMPVGVASKEDSDWRVAYLLASDAGDTEVAGVCMFGPMQSGIMFYAQAVDTPSLMICIASAVKELSSTTVPILVTQDEVYSCLLTCGINSQLYRKIDDGLLRIDSGHERTDEE